MFTLTKRVNLVFKNYKNMASLREHITKIHSDDKRPMFECTFCDKVFYTLPYNPFPLLTDCHSFFTEISS